MGATRGPRGQTAIGSLVELLYPDTDRSAAAVSSACHGRSGEGLGTPLQRLSRGGAVSRRLGDPPPSVQPQARSEPNLAAPELRVYVR